MKTRRWILIDDNDGHSYCIPADYIEAFFSWCSHQESDSDGEYKGQSFDDFNLGGCPTLLTFENPIYDGKVFNPIDQAKGM